MEWLTPGLRMAYRRTSYVVTDPATPLVLKVDNINRAAAELLQSRGLQSALFISAHNPWGACLSAEENRRRHTELLQDLQPWPLFEGFGVSHKGDWPAETSVLVLCDDPDLQLEWLQRFEQNAAVRVSDRGEVELVFNHLRPAVLPDSVTAEPAQLTLFSEFPPHQRLCFYPSSGYELLWAVMQLDCDLFVFSDKERDGIAAGQRSGPTLRATIGRWSWSRTAPISCSSAAGARPAYCSGRTTTWCWIDCSRPSCRCITSSVSATVAARAAITNACMTGRSCAG